MYYSEKDIIEVLERYKRTTGGFCEKDIYGIINKLRASGKGKFFDNFSICSNRNYYNSCRVKNFVDNDDEI